MSTSAQLIVPAIRWEPGSGYKGQQSHIDRALDLGCGGFIIFGGEVAAVRELTAELRERSKIPLLIASDLERGAGQQIAGATGLPPLAAIGASEEQGAASRAARLTATEALSLGINWVVAPVCDIDAEHRNPIIGTRSPGDDPATVAALVAEWIDACQASGALACAKHFPGHGRTAVDSHATLPQVQATRETLFSEDLEPFRAAMDAGVASILTAHVSYPALDPTGAPATLSRRIVHDLLRTEMGFQGLIVTDAMIMEGVLRGKREDEACIAALAAGCDLVLYPVDIPLVARGIESALASGALESEAIRKSLERRNRWATWAGEQKGESGEAARSWAEAFALSCVHEVRGQLLAVSSSLDVLIVDDDIGGPYPAPPREPFLAELSRMGVDARRVDAPSLDGRRTLVIALFGDIRSWKGRAGYSESSIAAVARALARDPGGIVLQFSHPRLAEEIPASARNVVSAWGGEKTMQEAAARWLAQRVTR